MKHAGSPSHPREDSLHTGSRQKNRALHATQHMQSETFVRRKDAQLASLDEVAKCLHADCHVQCTIIQMQNKHIEGRLHSSATKVMQEQDVGTYVGIWVCILPQLLLSTAQDVLFCPGIRLQTRAHLCQQGAWHEPQTLRQSNPRSRCTESVSPLCRRCLLSLLLGIMMSQTS